MELRFHAAFLFWMRWFFIFTLCGFCLCPVLAAPHARAKRSTQTAVVKAVPLPPGKIRGQVAYIQGRDVWCVDPRTRQKHLLFKDLFYPAKASLTPNGVTFHFDSTSIAWSPDRSLIAYVYIGSESSSGQIWVMRWDGKEKRLLAQGEACFAPQWSPDGKSIAFVRRGTSRSFGDGSISFGIVDVNGKAVALPAAKTADVGSTDYASIYNPRWSKDSKRVLLDYSPNGSDYIGEGPPLKHKVLSLDTLTYSDFQGDEREEFVFPDTSPDGQEYIEQNVWQRVRLNGHAAIGSIWNNQGGLNATRFIYGHTEGEFVFSDDWTQSFEDAKGRFQTRFSHDIWFLSPSVRVSQSDAPFRRIVQNAELVDWL